MKLDDKVIYIINKLEENGFESYVVGGACRDYYLNRENHDIDIVTTALLDEIKDIFTDEHFVSYQKGITLGLIHNKSLIDISSTNGKTIKEDILRRDFTINTLLYHHDKGYIDLLNSKDDINNKVIKAVKDPDEMILNDPIRILRAIRFEASLNFKIDLKLEESMFKNKDLLQNIASERIKDELNKILIVDKPSIYIKKYIEIFNVILPGIILQKDFNQHNKYHIYTVLDHTLKVLENTKNDIILRLSALLHDFDKPKYFTLDENGVGHFYGHDESSAKTAKTLLKKLRYPFKDIDRVVKLYLAKSH